MIVINLIENIGYSFFFLSLLQHTGNQEKWNVDYETYLISVVG